MGGVYEAEAPNDELGIAEELARVSSKSRFKPAKLREIERRKLLAKRRYVDLAGIAYACADLGDKEQTFLGLDKALADKPAASRSSRSFPHWTDGAPAPAIST